MVRWRRFLGRSNSDAEFRVWGQEINLALAALGWVQTADTGQVNWTTATRPAFSNTKAGYEIWRANDSFQSQAPFYVKLTYGSSGAMSRPRVWIQMGTGSNGSGTLTGASYETTADGNGEDGQATEYVFIGNAGRFCMLCNPGGLYTTGYSALCFLIERSYKLGEYTTEGGITVSLNPQTYSRRILVNPHKWGMSARASQVLAHCLFHSQSTAGHWTEGSIVFPLFYNFDNGFTAGEVGGACLVHKSSVPISNTVLLNYPAGQVREFFVSYAPEVVGMDGAGVDGRLAVLWEP